MLLSACWLGVALLGLLPLPCWVCCRCCQLGRLTALFFNGEPREVVLLQGEQAIRLPQQPSGSGARYGAANQSFWLKGDQATWQFGAGATYSCGPESLGAAGAVKRR